MALWKKTIGEARWLLLGCMAFMFAVHWLRVWISSFFTVSSLEGIFNLMPEMIEPLLPVSFTQMATSAGRIAVAYDDPIVHLLVGVWAVARGSDAVSGELNRGTMEMVLAQPVTRLGVLGTQSLVTLGGAAILAGTALFGTFVGLTTVTLEETISTQVFVPAALNLFAITVFLAGLSTMFSAGGNYRARTVGIMGGLYAVAVIVKLVGRMAPGWHWLVYCSFFTPFEPQMMVADRAMAWQWGSFAGPGWTDFQLGGLGYDGLLIGMGLVCYLAASLIFNYRDLPAPL